MQAPTPSREAPTAVASNLEAEQLTNQLSHDLMSPYCPGRTVATCASPQARKLEMYIKREFEEGKSRDEIEQVLVARYPDILGYKGRPELIIGMGVMALIAMIGLFVAARRWTRKRPVEAAVTGPAHGQHQQDALDDLLDRTEGF
ncbi:MAG: cytochrome c-type biogenesis protein [Nannocystaceae bacterium]